MKAQVADLRHKRGKRITDITEVTAKFKNVLTDRAFLETLNSSNLSKIIGRPDLTETTEIVDAAIDFFKKDSNYSYIKLL